MAGPFDLKIIAIIERRLDVLALQLVDDDAIVNALDRNAIMKEPVAALLDFCDADGLDAEGFLW